MTKKFHPDSIKMLLVDFCLSCLQIKTCKIECIPYLEDELNRIRQGKNKNKILDKVCEKACEEVRHNNSYDTLTDEEYEQKFLKAYIELRRSIRSQTPTHEDFPLHKFEPYRTAIVFKKPIHQFAITEKETGEIKQSDELDALLDNFLNLEKPEQNQVVEYVKTLAELKNTKNKNQV